MTGDDDGVNHQGDRHNVLESREGDIAVESVGGHEDGSAARQTGHDEQDRMMLECQNLMLLT